MAFDFNARTARHISRTQARIEAVIEQLENLSKQVGEERTYYTRGVIEVYVAGLNAGLKYLLHEKKPRGADAADRPESERDRDPS